MLSPSLIGGTFMQSADAFVPEPNSGCLLWLGYVDSKGYGQRRWRGKTIRVHRVAWEQAHGAIPLGVSVLHRCDVRSCANERHLYLGDQAQNVRDMYARGRARSQTHAPVAACKHGHAFTEANTYTDKRNRRHCKRCRADRQNKARHYGHYHHAR